jgi:hypothetical protein
MEREECEAKERQRRSEEDEARVRERRAIGLENAKQAAGAFVTVWTGACIWETLRQLGLSP